MITGKGTESSPPSKKSKSAIVVDFWRGGKCNGGLCQSGSQLIGKINNPHF